MQRPSLLIALPLLVFAACDNAGPTPVDSDTDGPPIQSMPMATPLTPTTVPEDGIAVWTVTGLDDRQAYRITLVHGDNITAAGDGTATFVDADVNGAADAGPSETVGLITEINGSGYVPGFKTVPSTEDDPGNPTGVYPEGGQFVITVEAQGEAGSIYPVIYHNGGESTFLEVDATGIPVETYTVGGSMVVEAPPPPLEPAIAPTDPQTVPIDDYYDYTINNLDDTQAWRITLVHGDNITAGPDQTGTFVDDDANGAADAGPSETVAMITQVNGSDVPGAKTVPDPADDPTAPTGVYPVGGQITVRVSGVGEGTVYPVAYYNGGLSTFLEIDAVTYEPIETYRVGGSLTVTAP